MAGEPLSHLRPASLAELAAPHSPYGPCWQALAQAAEAQGPEVTTEHGWLVPQAVPMAQAIHHVDDHRTHMLSNPWRPGLGNSRRQYAGSAGLMATA